MEKLALIENMNKTNIVKTKNGFVGIDTCELINPLGRLIDEMGLGNDDAIGKPYETMVFASSEDGRVEDWKELDKANYKTEKEAIIGHKKMVKKYETL